MFEKYTEAARRAVFFARHEASQFGTPEILAEHLLLGILQEDKALASRLLGEAEKVNSIHRRIAEATPRGKKISTSVDLPVSDSVKRAFANAAEEADRWGQPHIGTEHLLAGLLREEKSLAATILAEQGITLERLRAEAEESTNAPIQRAVARTGPAPAARSEPVFRDLTGLALEGQLGPLVGRERELERLIQILSRRTRRNAVLVGEPGVGKTAIVEGLAQRIANAAAPPGLAQRKVLALDAAALITPGRTPELVKNHPEAILFVHGLFDIAAAGYSWGVLEATRVSEPLLARSGFQAIATGTPAGYRRTLDKAMALALHFEPLPVLPPNERETMEILRGVKGQYEKYHDVIYSEEAIQAAVVASARFLRHRFPPDRALDLLDEAGALVSLRRAVGSSPEEREIRRRIRIASRKMENAIAMHEFNKAREFSDQEEAEQQKLRQLLEEQKPDPARSGAVAARDIGEVVAGRVGAPVSVVETLLRQPDAASIDRIARELIALVPRGREWLEPLAAYVAGCPAEDAEKLAAAIRAAKENTKE